MLTDIRSAKNGCHTLNAQYRQSAFGRLAGYEDINDADRLSHDPAMRWIVGGQAVMSQRASTSQMGWFETEMLANAENIAGLADLSGKWIDTVHAGRPSNVVLLDMDSSVNPIYRDREGSVHNGHFGCTCCLDWRFNVVEHMAIPEPDGSADMVYFSSVLRQFAQSGLKR